jgi:hypothetical protein
MALDYLLWLCGLLKARYYSNAISQFRPCIERSFGVRQLAAAFRPASLLAGISAERTIPRQQAGSSQSGSKLPHSKASHAGPAMAGSALRYFLA